MGRLVARIFGLRREERTLAFLMALYHVLLLVSLYLLVADRFDPGGDLLARIGVTGLLVHVASAGYYYATAPPGPEDGLFRY